MKFSTRGRYALWMMLDLARQQGRSVSLAEISKRTNISRRYLEQLATALKHARLLRGHAGRGGGYALTRPAGEIRVGEILEAVIGPVNVVECVRHPDICLKTEGCECRWLYATINERITSVLDQLTLGDLMAEPDPEQVRALAGGEPSACPTFPSTTGSHTSGELNR